MGAPGGAFLSDRIAALASKLQRITDAKSLTSTDVWSAAWINFEQELLERLLKCGPDDEVARWNLHGAIEPTRQVRRAIENEGTGEKALLQELDILEGRKTAPIA